jgi:hypothetical protein
MLRLAKKVNWFLISQLGLNVRLFLRSLFGLPKFARDLFLFRRQYKGNMKITPCLADYNQEGGSIKNEYFWQDLFVAQKVFLANPEIHVDIGSRIDSFVAHVASFREIVVFDIRDVTSKIPNVKFRQADLMESISLEANYCDSLSCLHALEHFGLGRYGDPLDANGYIKGLENMANLLKLDGTFYLSLPIGVETVEFNAHRVFDPIKLCNLAAQNQLKLEEFVWIDAANTINISAHHANDMKYLLSQAYNLGIFTFKKIS